MRVLLLLLTVPTFLQAGRWKEIGTTTSANPVFVDVRSIKQVDGIVYATVRVTYTKPVKVGKKEMTASRSTAMFDCTKNTFAVKENIFYVDERKNVVHTRSVNAKPGFGPAIKGSFADVALVYVCSAAPKAKSPNAKP